LIDRRLQHLLQSRVFARKDLTFASQLPLELADRILAAAVSVTKVKIKREFGMLDTGND
jgi:hypothetical protein